MWIKTSAYFFIKPFKLQRRVGCDVDLPCECVVLQREDLQHVEVGLPAESQAEDGRRFDAGIRFLHVS
jgi:hypothetical protein